MSIDPAILRAMAAAGASIEVILAAVEAAKAAEDAFITSRRAKAAAKKRRQRSVNSAVSPDVPGTDGEERGQTGTLGDDLPPPPDGPLSFPQTPNLSPLNPPTTIPDMSGKPDSPALKSSKAGKVHTKPDYPGDFEMLWAEFPRNPNSSKLEGFRSWSRLYGLDRDHCFEGAVAYARWLGSQQRPPPPLHLATFINQRRFDGFTEQQVAQ